VTRSTRLPLRLVRGEDYAACTRYANACGALVVSRHGCAPAMPTRVELDYFIAHADRIPAPRPRRDADRLHRGHRATRAAPTSCSSSPSTTVRSSSRWRRRPARTSRGCPAWKQLLVEAVRDRARAWARRARWASFGDDRYGQDALNAATGRGWWIGARPSCRAAIRWSSITAGRSERR